MADRAPEPEARDEAASVWVGRITPGHEAEHEQFVAWLASAEAAEIFRRRRLTAYVLAQADAEVRILFKAPRTGDPRIMIDFLRYPGLWPDYWEFVRGGRDDTATVETLARDATVRVRWQRPEAGA